MKEFRRFVVLNVRLFLGALEPCSNPALYIKRTPSDASKQNTIDCDVCRTEEGAPERKDSNENHKLCVAGRPVSRKSSSLGSMPGGPD